MSRIWVFWPAYASTHGKNDGCECGSGKRKAKCGVGYGLRRTREMVSHGVVLGVVLELLRRDGGAKEVLEVLEDILLGRRKRARLGVLIEG